jgi:hypothetical protein
MPKCAAVVEFKQSLLDVLSSPLPKTEMEDERSNDSRDNGVIDRILETEYLDVQIVILAKSPACSHRP